MTPDERARMNELCAEIQQEKDYEKFEHLTQQLSALIGRKEQRFPEHKFMLPTLTNKGWKLMPAIVNKVLKPSAIGSEKIEISIPEAEDLFREIRVENVLTDAKGNMLALQQGAPLDVRLEANKETLIPKVAST